MITKEEKGNQRTVLHSVPFFSFDSFGYVVVLSKDERAVREDVFYLDRDREHLLHPIGGVRFGLGSVFLTLYMIRD